MNRLAPSLLVVNFWDIDIAHYGAYSLYLEAIRRTDRLVHELWQHAQSLPQYRDRTTLLVVPELGRTATSQGTASRTTAAGTSRAGACGSSPSARACPRVPGQSAHPDSRRRADRGAHSRFQDAGVRGPAARGTGFLGVAMQFDAGLTGDAAALARAHAATLDGLPATVACVHPRGTPEMGDALRCRASLPAARCWISCRGCQSRMVAGHGRHHAGRDRGRLRSIARGNPARFQDDAQALLRKRQLLTAWRKEIDGFFSTIDPALDAQLYPPDAPRRLVVQLYGSGIAVQSDKLWSRFKGTGIRVPLNLAGSQGSEAFLRALFGARDDGGMPLLAAQPGPPAAVRSTAGSSNRTKRCTCCATRRRTAPGVEDSARGDWSGRRRADRLELRTAARISRRADASALQQDRERRREPAGVCRLCPKPEDRARSWRPAPLRRPPPGLRARHPAHGQRDALREQHVRRMGRRAGAQTRAAAGPGDPVRRPRQAQTVQQPAALLPAARLRSDSADRRPGRDRSSTSSSCRITCG